MKIEAILDRKNGVCHRLGGIWTEESARQYAEQELGLVPSEYQLESNFINNNSDQWPD
jgi:hypothetical protein